jgi:hypothetical protein
MNSRNGRRDFRWQWKDHVVALVVEKALSAHAGLVARALLDFADKDGIAFPSQTTLAAVTGLSPRTVWQALNELERHGLVAKVRRGHPGSSSNVYRIRLRESRATCEIRGERHSVEA